MRRAPISRYVMKKDPFGVFSLSVYWRSDLVQVPRYSRLPENLIITKEQSFLSQIFAEIQTFIYLLGDRLCPVGHKNPPQQLMVHFPPPQSSQKNPITAVFGDQQDYSVSKEKQSRPICCPSAAGVTSCNEVPYFSLPPLSPLLHLPLYFAFLSFCLFFLFCFYGVFFSIEFSLNPLLLCAFTRVIPPETCRWSTCAESGYLTAENREESLWVVVTFGDAAFSAHLLTLSYPRPPPPLPPPLGDVAQRRRRIEST